MTQRRTIVAGGLGAVTLLAAGSARAAWPDKPIRLVVPYAPGGSTDLMARFLAPHLSEKLGASVIVDNKPGGSTLIGADYVVKSKPDGYTLLMGTTSMGMLVLRKAGSPIDTRKDFAPIIAFAESVYVVLASPGAPFKTLPEMIAYAKANPDRVTYGTTGTGTTPHLAGEYLSSAAGIKTVNVPYKGGGPLTVALLGGETMMAMDSIGPTNPLIREGKLNLLATTGAQRSKAFPNVPTVGETLPGFSAGGYFGLFSTLGTPKEIVDQLNAAMVAIVAKPEVQERILSWSLNPITTTPAEYQRLTVDEVEKWGRVVRQAGIVIE